MNIEGDAIRLRAVEPADADLLYTWENDAAIWSVSGTTEPFSRHQMERFIAEQQQADIFRTGQLRLIIETKQEAGLPETGPGSEMRRRLAFPGTMPDRNWDAPCGTASAGTTPDGAAHAGTTLDRNWDAPCRTASAGTTPGSTFPAGKPIGAIDLFEFDPLSRRAGIGILIHATADRRCGYAADAVETLCRYTREQLGMHQLWCNVGADNPASLRLFRHAGFTEIGTKREWQWRADGFHDEIMMQKIL